MNPPPLVSVVIATDGPSPLVDEALKTLTSDRIETLLVVPSPELAREQGWDRHPAAPRILRGPEGPGGRVSRALNHGVAAAAADWVGLLPPGTAPDPGWPLALVRELDARGFDFGGGLVRFFYSPALVRSSGYALTSRARVVHRAHRRPDDRAVRHVAEVFATPWHGAVYRKQTFLETGGFAPEFGDQLADADWGWRASRRGARGLVVPAASVRHRALKRWPQRPDDFAQAVRSRWLLALRNLAAPEVPRFLGFMWDELAAAREARREGRIGPWLRGTLGGMRALGGLRAFRFGERVHARRPARWFAPAGARPADLSTHEYGPVWADGSRARAGSAAR